VADQQQQRYAPRRKAQVVAWCTALLMPALVGWAFTTATANLSDAQAPAGSRVVVSVVAVPR
jgi:hypothetical protein